MPLLHYINTTMSAHPIYQVQLGLLIEPPVAALCCVTNQLCQMMHQGLKGVGDQVVGDPVAEAEVVVADIDGVTVSSSPSLKQSFILYIYLILVHCVSGSR
jgi:hypothetical protein